MLLNLIEICFNLKMVGTWKMIMKFDFLLKIWFSDELLTFKLEGNPRIPLVMIQKKDYILA